MNEYIILFCLIVVICLLVYLQYALGVKKVSVRTALTLPIGYAVVFSLLTLVVAGVTTNSLLFLSSQLVVAHWLYDWGTNHPQQVRPVPAHKHATTSLILKNQK